MTEPRLMPADDHNDALLANVRPRDWKNPAPLPVYNLVVIGAGTAGLVTAAGAAGLGARVALIERHLLGGDCLNYGCVPSKALIRSARLWADLRDAAAWGIDVPGGSEVNFAAVMERMRRLRAGLSQHDAAARFRALGVDVFYGEAQFTGPRTVDVNGARLHFNKAVIATGARPAAPDIPGISESGYLTNETIFSLTTRPARLLVLGGGPLGCEMAQAMGRLGCRVTLLHKYGRLMNREDADAAALIQQVLAREGVELILDAQAERVEQTSGGKKISYHAGRRAGEVEVDEILAGIGRTPNVEALGLERAGVACDQRAGVVVNDRLQTTNRHIFAAGDVCLPLKFTHLADAAARLVIANALFWGRRRFSALTIPWCTYTDPEVARVGLSEADAAARGLAVQAWVRPLSEVDRAVVDGEIEGFIKILTRQGRDSIVGATLVARHAGEMINEITLAMGHKIGLKKLSGVIHPYPTQAEAIRQAADACQRSRLTPLFRRWLTRYFAWRR